MDESVDFYYFTHLFIVRDINLKDTRLDRERPSFDT